MERVIDYSNFKDRVYTVLFNIKHVLLSVDRVPEQINQLPDVL